MRAGVAACAIAALTAAAVAAHDDALVVSAAMIGGAFTHVVERGDSVAELGSRFGIDRAVIARENGLSATTPLAPGRALALDNRHIVPAGHDAAIVINVPQRMLYSFDREAGAIGYPAAVGQPGWKTPRGPFAVIAAEERPTWHVPPSIQEEMRRLGRPVLTEVPPGPDNPLGEFWLGLSLPGIGIHGTSAPTSIYRAVTHGCIRLRADAAQALFLRAAVGTKGVIVYEPVLVAVIDRTVFLEAHPDIYRLAAADPMPALGRAIHDAGLDAIVDWTGARRVLDSREGIARPIGSAGTSQQARKGREADARRYDEAGSGDPRQHPR